MIFALFCRILRQFWASELPKILIYIQSTKDTVLSILACPPAVVKVFLEKKNSKKFFRRNTLKIQKKAIEWTIFRNPVSKSVHCNASRLYKFYLVSFETFQSQTKYFEPLTGSKSDREEILKHSPVKFRETEKTT